MLAGDMISHLVFGILFQSLLLLRLPFLPTLCFCLLPPPHSYLLLAGVGTAPSGLEVCWTFQGSVFLASLHTGPCCGNARHSMKLLLGEVRVDHLAGDARVFGQQMPSGLPFAEGETGPGEGPVTFCLTGMLAEHMLLVGKIVGMDDLAEVAREAHHGSAALFCSIHVHVLGFQDVLPQPILLELGTAVITVVRHRVHLKCFRSNHNPQCIHPFSLVILGRMLRALPNI